MLRVGVNKGFHNNLRGNLRDRRRRDKMHSRCYKGPHKVKLPALIGNPNVAPVHLWGCRFGAALNATKASPERYSRAARALPCNANWGDRHLLLNGPNASESKRASRSPLRRGKIHRWE